MQTITLVRWETLWVSPTLSSFPPGIFLGGEQCTEVASLGRGGGDGGSGLLAQLEFVGQTIGTDVKGSPGQWRGGSANRGLGCA